MRHLKTCVSKHAFLIFIFYILLLTHLPNAFAQSEDIDRISNFSHYREDDCEVLTFNVKAVGSYHTFGLDINDLSKTEDRPINDVFAIVATRYPSNPDKMFFIPVVPDFATSEQSVVGHDKNKRPIISIDYKFSPSLFDHNKTSNTAYGFGKMQRSVKDWKIPAIANPDQVQILLFLSFADAAEGKNVKIINVPMPGKEGIFDNFSVAKDAIPGGIVFGLMFVVLGLSGAAAGVGASGVNKGGADNAANSAQDGETASEIPAKKEEEWVQEKVNEDEQEDPDDLSLFLDIDSEILYAGKSKPIRLTAYLRGDSKRGSDLLNQVDLSVSGNGADFVLIEKSSPGVSDRARTFDISLNYKLDSEFYQGDRGLDFPQHLILNILKPTTLKSSDSSFKILLKAPEPKIHLSQKSIIIAENSSDHPRIKAWVSAVDEGEWEFSVHPVADLESAVADAKCKKITGRECHIKIKADNVEEGAGQSVTSELQVYASNKLTGTNAAASISVTAAKEGLILVSQTPIRIAADGESETEIEIAAVRAIHGKFTTDFDLLSEIFFSTELTTTSKTSANAFSTAKLEFLPKSYLEADEACWRNIKGFSEGGLSSFSYRVKTSRFLPGQGESFNATAHLGDRSGKHKLAIPLMLDVDLMQTASRAWEKELQRCRMMVSKLPEKHQAKMSAMLEKRSMFLGAQGLFELRRRIWTMGQTLWEAEGLSGYESVEQWAGYIEDTLNFSQWTGRMATDFLLANKLKMGVFAAMAAGELYDLLLSGIKAYQDDKSFDAWIEESFWREIKEMVVDMGAMALEPDRFVAKFSNNKKVIAIAWSVQFVYHFTANLSVHKLSVIDAAKKAAMTVATAAALKFLAKKAASMAKKKGINTKQLEKVDDNVDEIAEKGWKRAEKKVSDLNDAIKKGDKKAIKQKLLEIQSDKFALKEINKWPDDIKKAYNKEMGKIYASIDRRVKKKIIQDLKAKGFHVTNKDLKMTNATNASKTIKVGSDRDISVEYSFVDKNGKTVTLEYPKDKLRDVYGRELYRSVGHRNAGDMVPDELMDKYDQYAIDSKDAEAYGKKKFNYENGKYENRDFEKIINKGELPQKLDDGVQIGMTASYKGKHWFNKALDAGKSGSHIDAESFKMEGMSQLVKQYKNIYKPQRQLLDSMGKRMADDNSMKKLIGMMEKAVNLEKSPSYVEKLVKKNGFSSLNEFADSFGGRIAAMNSMID